jgi:hypothetical protein
LLAPGLFLDRRIAQNCSYQYKIRLAVCGVVKLERSHVPSRATQTSFSRLWLRIPEPEQITGLMKPSEQLLWTTTKDLACFI